MEKCERCEKSFKGKGSRKVGCSVCNGKFHLTCAGITEEQLDLVEGARSVGINWECKTCSKLKQQFIDRLIKLEKQVSRQGDES